jgi:hypothetical protein
MQLVQVKSRQRQYHRNESQSILEDRTIDIIDHFRDMTAGTPLPFDVFASPTFALHALMSWIESLPSPLPACELGPAQISHRTRFNPRRILTNCWALVPEIRRPLCFRILRTVTGQWTYATQYFLLVASVVAIALTFRYNRSSFGEL